MMKLKRETSRMAALGLGLALVGGPGCMIGTDPVLPSSREDTDSSAAESGSGSGGGSSGASGSSGSTSGTTSGTSSGSSAITVPGCEAHSYTTAGFVSVAGAHATYGINHATTANRRAETPSSVWFQGKLWVAFTERDSEMRGQIRVKVFDPATGSWTRAEATPSAADFPDLFSPADCSGVNVGCRSAARPKIIEFNNQVYLFWEEHLSYDGTTNRSQQIRGAVFSGSLASPQWNLIDGGVRRQDNQGTGADGGFNLNRAVSAKEVTAVVHDGSLVIAWIEDNAVDAFLHQVRAMKYSGSGSTLASWTRIDSGNASSGIGGLPTAQSYAPHLISKGSHLYVAFAMNNEGEGELLRYQGGTTWSYFLSGGEGIGVPVTTPGYDPYVYSTVSSATTDSKIYLGFYQDGADNNSSMMRIQSFTPGDTTLGVSDGGSNGTLDHGLSFGPSDFLLTGSNHSLLALGADSLVALWSERLVSDSSSAFRLRMKRSTDGGASWSSFTELGGASGSLNRNTSGSATRISMTLDPDSCKIYYAYVQFTGTSVIDVDNLTGASSIEVGVIE